MPIKEDVANVRLGLADMELNLIRDIANLKAQVFDYRSVYTGVINDLIDADTKVEAKANVHFM